jgi:hypothetical protein
LERIAALSAWDSFYVIVGSSSAALTGLQFVVISVIGADPEPPSSTAEIGAFGTPTVVHFCAALLVSVILSAPWHGISPALWTVGACGIAGIVYTAAVIRRARRQQGYQLVMEDWIGHAVLPAVAYLCLVAAALWVRSAPAESLFLVGGATVLLVFIGIHNAWDAVTYIAIDKRRQKRSG